MESQELTDEEAVIVEKAKSHYHTFDSDTAVRQVIEDFQRYFKDPQFYQIVKEQAKKILSEKGSSENPKKDRDHLP